MLAADAPAAGDPASRVLYRDADILIIDKPAGLAVHEAPGAGATLEPWLEALRFGLKWRPGLAHRLDRDTSGCLVLGRHPQALRALNALFAEGAVEKRYWAAVAPPPAGSEGAIELALKRVRRGQAWLTVADRRGQAACTRWRLIAADATLAWLDVMPQTGRTHQIRVHCAESGMPIVGDRLYGGVEGDGCGLQLHARAIAFDWRRKRIEAESPVPNHMVKTLERFPAAMGAVV